MTSDVNYIDEIPNQQRKYIDEFFESILPDNNDREYIL